MTGRRWPDPTMHAPGHHPTSRTLKTPTLAQRWLDVDIPTATHPTMRRRWANVALSIITQLREQWKCICCPNVGSTLIFQPCPILPCVDFGPALPGRPSPDVAHTQMHICWLNVEICDHDQSDHDAPTLGQGCLADHHPTSRTLKMPTLIR